MHFAESLCEMEAQFELRKNWTFDVPKPGKSLSRFPSFPAQCDIDLCTPLSLASRSECE
jgi:hypothetical protein